VKGEKAVEEIKRASPLRRWTSFGMGKDDRTQEGTRRALVAIAGQKQTSKATARLMGGNEPGPEDASKMKENRDPAHADERRFWFEKS